MSWVFFTDINSVEKVVPPKSTYFRLKVKDGHDFEVDSPNSWGMLWDLEAYPCLIQCVNRIQWVFIECRQWVNHYANIMEKGVTYFKGTYVQMRYASLQHDLCNYSFTVVTKIVSNLLLSFKMLSWTFIIHSFFHWILIQYLWYVNH